MEHSTAGRRRRTRRRRPLRTLAVLALLALAVTLFFYDQQNRIQPETLEVWSQRLPAGFDGFRIVQISDLHAKEFGTDNRVLLEQVEALDPDIIAVTGDLVDSPTQLSWIDGLAPQLVAIAPTYYVTGNHEWAIRQAREIKLRLEEKGVVPLSNEFLTLERNGSSIALAGIDDPNGPYDQQNPQQVMDELRQALGTCYTVLLAHRNEYHEVYAEVGADLTLCGHVHGGVIRLPLLGGLIDNTRRRLFPNYTAGLYTLDGGGTMMVSRGMGNGGSSFRLFNRPHLPVLILRAGSAPAS